VTPVAPPRPPLPIDAALPDIVAAVNARACLVLRAAPGAGKTTRVPAALLDAGIGGAADVVVLEPRRIAARAAAEFVARERGGRPGGEVGYRVRFEQRGGPATRLWFVTEGVFGRRLAADPFLEGTGVVVLDEFHERHLSGDVALAVVRHLQATVRPDLRLVVMSATLATDAVARALGDPAVIAVEGRAYPVAIEHEDAPSAGRPLADRVAAAVRRALVSAGDVLVFLPGAAEIRRATDALAPLAAVERLDVVPLHGELPLDAQERALRPGARRRVVLATNVAETALTVEGVGTVVDAGLARIARFDPRHGINTVRVHPVSRASAAQRAGRAGRTAPGRCIRLWSRADDAGRRAEETPEILRLDLSRMLLELHAWGLAGPRDLVWLDPPPAAAIARAERLLGLLGAIDAAGALTALGRRMLALPVEPRIARLLVEAETAGCAADGALVAALASERDVLAAALPFASATATDLPPGPSDLLVRVELFADARRRGLSPDACRPLGLEPRAVHAVERARRQLVRLVGRASADSGDPAALGRAVLAGFPDRVARRRAPGSPRALMVGATGVVLDAASVVREAELFVAVDIERTGGPEARVRIASAIEVAWLDRLFPGAVTETRVLVFDESRGRVVARAETRYHDLVLAERVRTDVDRDAAGAVLAGALATRPAAVVAPADDELLERVGFLRRAMPELGWPEPDALLAAAVTMASAGRASVAEVREAGLRAGILAGLAPAQRAALAREAPVDYRLPSGRAARIRYAADRPPVVAARIQDVFGLAATPRLAGGRVPLVVELLAPSGRPVQVTADLASFWATTYAEVRKQLRGRYPKHDWPEDPAHATPRGRTRR
jgi:ATP-dependent helicase HrpB